MSTSETPQDQERELLHKAIECYLSTIVSFANCIADICPDIGVPFRNQWRRLPQRIGFDSTPETLEKSRTLFERSLESLRQLAQAYFGAGLPALRQIGETGGRAVDLVLERNASYSVMMATLADSLAATADLNAPPELRDQLEHHAAGLRAGARKVETEIIPTLAELQKVVQTCEDLIQRIQETSVVDLDTGLLNAQGFLRELSYAIRQGPACVVCVDLTAMDGAGKALAPERFHHLSSPLAERIAEQFRALDSIGRLGEARFAVLFAGTAEQARGRQLNIARGISGIYGGPEGRIKVKAELKVLEIDTVEPVEALVDKVPETVPMARA
jgi:GGDEF domain-containing protein